MGPFLYKRGIPPPFSRGCKPPSPGHKEKRFIDFAINSIHNGGLAGGGIGKRVFFPRGIDFALSEIERRKPQEAAK